MKNGRYERDREGILKQHENTMIKKMNKIFEKNKKMC